MFAIYIFKRVIITKEKKSKEFVVHRDSIMLVGIITLSCSGVWGMLLI